MLSSGNNSLVLIGSKIPNVQSVPIKKFRRQGGSSDGSGYNNQNGSVLAGKQGYELFVWKFNERIALA